MINFVRDIDNKSTQYKEIRLIPLDGNGKPVKTEYDITNLRLDIKPTNDTTSGVTCVCRVSGAAENGKQQKITFTSYSTLEKALCLGTTCIVVIRVVTKDPKKPYTEYRIANGRVSSVGRVAMSFEGVVMNQLEVSISHEWDFLSTFPSGRLIVPSYQSTGELISKSLILTTRKATINGFFAALPNSTEGNNWLDVASAAALIMDAAESTRENSKDKIPNVIRAAINTENAPCVKVPTGKGYTTNVIKNINDRAIALLQGGRSGKASYLHLLGYFYLYLVPKLNSTTGVWGLHPCIDNVWSNTIADSLTLGDISGITQHANAKPHSGFDAVAVRVNKKNNSNSAVGGNITNSEIYTYVPYVSGTPATMKIYKGKAGNRKDQGKIEIDGGISVPVNNVVLKELPSWLNSTFDGTGKPPTDFSSLEKWALLIAQAEFSRYSRREHTMVITIIPSISNLLRFTQLVGDIISVNMSEEANPDFLYGRVGAVSFSIESALNKVQFSLKIVLQGVRTDSEQKALAIPNTDLFHLPSVEETERDK